MSDEFEHDFGFDLDPVAHMAKFLAHGVRNALEVPHNDGAFDNDQAPLLNRAVRNRLFEMLVALKLGANDDTARGKAAINYVLRFSPNAEDIMATALREAVACGITDYARATQASVGITETLTAVGGDGLDEAFELYKRYFWTVGGCDDRATFHAVFHLNQVAPYWEEPVLSRDFLETLGIDR